jgi:hypothetical protein
MGAVVDVVLNFVYIECPTKRVRTKQRPAAPPLLLDAQRRLCEASENTSASTALEDQT